MDITKAARIDTEGKILAVLLAGSAPPEYTIYASARAEVSSELFEDEACRSLFSSIEKCAQEGVHLGPRELMARSEDKSPAFKRALQMALSYAPTEHASPELLGDYLKAKYSAASRSKFGDLLLSAQVAVDHGEDLADIHLDIAQDLAQLAQEDNNCNDYHLLGEAVHDVLEQLRQVWGGDVAKIPFIPTQWERLNAKIGGGWYKKTMNLIGARPSVGKTSVAEHEMLYHAKGDNPIASIIGNAEMTRDQHAIRIGLQNSGMSLSMSDLWGVGFDKTHPAEAQSFLRSMREIQEKPIIFCADGETSIIKMARAIRAALGKMERGKYKPGLLFLDYIQLMKYPSVNAFSRTEEIASASRILIQIAKEFDLALVLLAQMNRDMEGTSKGGAREPRMSDIKDCGALEQDAWNILFPHRPSITGGEKRKDEREEQKSEYEDADFIIAKARSGSTGKISMRFHGPTQTFTERSFGSSKPWDNHAPF